MTPQEILDQEGFLIYLSTLAVAHGAVVVNGDLKSMVAFGTKLVVIGEVTRAEALEWAARVRCNIMPARHYYKVIAE